MAQPNLQSADLSRSRLKQLAAWIRDELDPVIAQNGPDVMRADDVLTLHEIFQTLQASSSITMLDLRATGIHRAIMEVAGTATRWPGRLADDCDRIIETWTHKFGRLEALHPFMYGRGGRLEGMATVGDFSKAVLLKRWENTCPEKIDPKVSQRQGDLGFKAGAWWINPLFAYHDGIIDLESTDGGLCFNNKAAYALVLQDTGETAVSTESAFSYRCKQDDKGRYRLTAANAKSREPIRVLRCHSVNCPWGPKAGIRYEGLHRVVGWSIYTAKTDDTIGGHHKAGDVVYEVSFERVDPVPMEEVMKHPTAAELDDSTEYKRLKRFDREERRKAAILGTVPESLETQLPAKHAPQIAPASMMPKARPTVIKTSPNPTPGASRTPTFNYSMPKRRGRVQPQPSSTGVSASPAGSAHSRSPAPSPSPGYVETSSTDWRGNTLGVGQFPSVKSEIPSNSSHSKGDSPLSEHNRQLHVTPPASEKESTGSRHSDIREVVPWIDYDLELVAAAPSISERPNRSPVPRSTTTAKPKQRERSKSQSQNSHLVLPGTAYGIDPFIETPSEGTSSIHPPSVREEGKLAVKGGEGRTNKSSLADLAKKDGRKAATPSRSHNPLSKFFDGTANIDDVATHYASDYFSHHPEWSTSHSSSPSQDGTSYSDRTIRPLSPTPVRPRRPSSPLVTSRRDAVCYPSASPIAKLFAKVDHGRTRPGPTPILDPFVEARYSRPKAPFAMENFISSPRAATAVSVSTVSTILTDRRHSSEDMNAHGLQKIARRPTVGSPQERIVFKNPFKKRSESAEPLKRHNSEGVETLAPTES